MISRNICCGIVDSITSTTCVLYFSKTYYRTRSTCFRRQCNALMCWISAMSNLCFQRPSRNQNIYIFAPVWAASGFSQKSTSPVYSCQFEKFLSSNWTSGNTDNFSKFIFSVANYYSKIWENLKNNKSNYVRESFALRLAFDCIFTCQLLANLEKNSKHFSLFSSFFVIFF